MDIGALSDQELLNYVIFLGAGAVVFALVFVVTMVVYIRGRQATTKRAPAPDAKRVAATSAREENDTMSLLKSRIKKTQETAADAQTAVKTPAPIQSIQSATVDVAYHELLRVLVDPSGEKIVVEVEGRRYEAISQIKDRAIGRRILETIAALLKFSGGYIATAEGTKVLPTPNVKLTVLPAKSAPFVSPSPASATQARPTQAQSPEMSPAVAEFLADMEAAGQSMQQVETPETPQSFWGRAFKGGDKSVAAPEAPTFSLAEEIDKIVQQKLKAANEWTRVKIQSGAGGMVRFQVADKVYESVDRIEEVNVQAIIKSAIEEWNG
ncbi:MAG TPA: hypothetical protein G4N96_00180 [Chloroflexi bacterium]|nr:hypothetical protein [Chloroflexota bacterium]